MSLREWFESKIDDFGRSYLSAAHDAAFGQETTGYVWTSLEKNTGDMLKAGDIAAASKLRYRGIHQRSHMPTAENPTVQQVLEENPWLADHAKITHENIDIRARLVAETERVWMVRKGRLLAQDPELPVHRLEMMYRMAIGEVTNIAEQVQLSSPEMASAFPYSRYGTRDDARVRPTHRSMQGFVAHRDWYGWTIVRPKNGFNCRCYLRHVSWPEAIREGWAKKIGEPRIMVKWPNSAAKRNFEQGFFPDQGWQGPKFVAQTG